MSLSAIGAAGASAAAPTIASTAVSEVTTGSATLEASINPGGIEAHYHFEYGLANCASNPCTSVPVPEGKIPTGGSPVAVEETIAGLKPGTVYHFRVVAKNGATPADKKESPDRVFATYSIPLSGLPDGRAYEQASPVDKDGGDVIGTVPQVKASPEGDAVAFSSTVGIPGGVGAQEIPLFLARRGTGGWSTHGVQPPASAGQLAKVLGWLPDFSQVFSSTTKLGDPDTGALLGMPGSGGEPQDLTSYVPKAEYKFLGSAGEGAEVVFESRASLGSPAGVAGASNVYAWDREGGEVSLVSVQNDEEPLTKGAFGGSYDWAPGMSPTNLSRGGAARDYYTQDQHAVAADGAVFFTEAGSGQLYMRLNPTEPQSALNGEGKCKEPQMACTIHVSASQLTPPDPAGPRPAAFVGAAADGSAAFFTSPEKLAPGANTGPVQPKPKIGRSDINGETDLLQDFLADHRGVGIAVDSKYVYWADPAAGTIGRAELDGANPDDEFIKELPLMTVEEEVETEPGSGEFKKIVKQVPNKPRYVAVDAGHVYWTNTADEKNDHGTIGRATINPVTEEPEDIRPECVKGASNPQGIAVNATNIYWANNSIPNGSVRSIGRAGIDCEGADQSFVELTNSDHPYGVALSATDVYWTRVEDGGGSYLGRASLDGTGPTEKRFIDNGSELRGIALDGNYLYWAAQGTRKIGRFLIADWELGICAVNPGCEKEFIELEGAPSGVAVDAEHIFFSTNGEIQPSPGNDLYRFVPNDEGGGTLSDLTPDAADENGAEVQGVVGVSADGARVYFTANAVLDGEEKAKAGSCAGSVSQPSGQCSLYLWHEGTTSLIARLDATQVSLGGDVADWAPTATAFSGGDFQKTAFLSADGQTLLFRSQEQLGAYDNEGVPELYRYREGEPIVCISCKPTGEAPQGSLTLGSIKPSTLTTFPGPASLASRNLSADGNRAFFETTEALVASDTNGVGGCPLTGSALQRFPSCRDVYEWEAPDTGSCSESAPTYSPLNSGCLYLISTGKDHYPSLFADASADGKNVFFFTRQGLVGQDKDELLDVYDARVGGGIAAQNPPPAPPPCEGADACHGPIPPTPAEGQPTTQTFVGPGNQVPKAGKKAKKQKKHKAKKKQKKQGHRGARRAGAERGARR